ncbi:MAG: protease modulator HflC [Acidobacteriota bacterium]|nr:protease modulator HflC [Acidobacteriota bacterium]
MRSLGALLIVALALIFLAGNTLYIVHEPEQVIITQFGKPQGKPRTDPNIYVKVPFIQKVNRFDKRWLAWDGDPNQVPTKDKKYIWVDCYARWRIADPLKYFQVVRNETLAQSRLDDIIDGETRNVIASYDLIEVVRATNRTFEVTEELKGLVQTEVGAQIKTGRDQLAREILERAAAITPDFGIELVDVRFKRINYIESVQKKVYERMIAERKRIAEQYRSEGQGKSAEIRGQMERELKKIRSEAYRTAQELRGKADGESTRIYAEAYNRDPSFYAFTRSLQAWEKSLTSDTQMVLTTDAEFLRYMKQPR